MTVPENAKSKIYKVSPAESNPMVRARLRTLLELAVVIGRREGLLGNNGDFNIEGGPHVTNKGNIRDREATQTGQDPPGRQEEE